MSGAWSVPEVDLSAEEHVAYKALRDSDTTTFLVGNQFSRMPYYVEIERKARTDYAPKAEAAFHGDKVKAYNTWMSGVTVLSREENGALRRTWYRLVVSGCDVEAEELFWNMAALEPSVRSSLGVLGVGDLGSFADLDEWGLEEAEAEEGEDGL